MVPFLRSTFFFPLLFSLTLPPSFAGMDDVDVEMTGLCTMPRADDELDSLFGDGDEFDAEMASLFGECDDSVEDKAAAAAVAVVTRPAPFFPFPLPDAPLQLPLPVPSCRQESDHRSSNNTIFCDVSTLFPENHGPHDRQGQQQQQQQQHRQKGHPEGQEEAHVAGCLLFPLTMSECASLDALSPDFDLSFHPSTTLDIDLEAELALQRELEQELARNGMHMDMAVDDPQETPKTPRDLTPQDDDAAAARDRQPLHLLPPQQHIVDTSFFDATGPDAHGDQVGHGRIPLPSAARALTTPQDEDSDDDVIVLSVRQVVPGFVPPPTLPTPMASPAPPPAVSTPHYLELRPRCPQGPPPPRIDLNGESVEELLPHVQLCEAPPLVCLLFLDSFPCILLTPRL